jgi:hypothetical protein
MALWSALLIGSIFSSGVDLSISLRINDMTKNLPPPYAHSLIAQILNAILELHVLQFSVLSFRWLI